MPVMPLIPYARYSGGLDFSDDGVYWDAYSHEQRIKEIAKRLRKIVNWITDAVNSMNQIVELANSIQQGLADLNARVNQFEHDVYEYIDTKDADLLQRINANATAIANEITARTQAVAAEVARAQAAEAALGTQISTEAGRAQAAEAALQTAMGGYVPKMPLDYVLAGDFVTAKADGTIQDSGWSRATSFTGSTTSHYLIPTAKAVVDYVNAQLAGISQTWLPSVNAVADLPTVPDATKTYLCKVISTQEVYQWIGGGSAWTLFSDESDYATEEELAAAVQAEATTRGQNDGAIIQSIVNLENSLPTTYVARDTGWVNNTVMVATADGGIVSSGQTIAQIIATAAVPLVHTLSDITGASPSTESAVAADLAGKMLGVVRTTASSTTTYTLYFSA